MSIITIAEAPVTTHDEWRDVQLYSYNQPLTRTSGLWYADEGGVDLMVTADEEDDSNHSDGTKGRRFKTWQFGNEPFYHLKTFFGMKLEAEGEI